MTICTVLLSNEISICAVCCKWMRGGESRYLKLAVCCRSSEAAAAVRAVRFAVFGYFVYFVYLF